MESLEKTSHRQVFINQGSKAFIETVSHKAHKVWMAVSVKPMAANTYTDMQRVCITIVLSFIQKVAIINTPVDNYLALLLRYDIVF